MLKKYSTVIFVNGCFWYEHKGCTKYMEPKSNKEFWQHKIMHNWERYRMNCKKANEERLRKFEAIAAAEAELDMKFEIPRRIKKMSYENYM